MAATFSKGGPHLPASTALAGCDDPAAPFRCRGQYILVCAPYTTTAERWEPDQAWQAPPISPEQLKTASMASRWGLVVRPVLVPYAVLALFVYLPMYIRKYLVRSVTMPHIRNIYTVLTVLTVLSYNRLTTVYGYHALLYRWTAMYPVRPSPRDLQGTMVRSPFQADREARGRD